jgi:hypothetical protein
MKNKTGFNRVPFVLVQMFSNKQSSEYLVRSMLFWGQMLPNDFDMEIEETELKGCGGINRNSPYNGAAYGIAFHEYELSSLDPEKIPAGALTVNFIITSRTRT